jgi:hypothetical protein
MNHSIDDNDTNRTSKKKQFIKPILKMPSSLVYNPKDHSPRRSVRFDMMDMMDSSKCNSPIEKQEHTIDESIYLHKDNHQQQQHQHIFLNSKHISISKLHDNYINDLHDIHDQYISAIRALHEKYVNSVIFEK